MAEQLYWQEVEVNSEIPSLSKVATTAMLIKWAGAAGDFNPLHFDDAFAWSQGVERPIVHGALKRQWLIQLLTDWMGEEGRLQKFSCRFRAMDYPRAMKTTTDPVDGETWRCRGKIIKKYVHEGKHCLDCDVWLENGRGEITTTGNATVILPSRG